MAQGTGFRAQGTQDTSQQGTQHAAHMLPFWHCPGLNCCWYVGFHGCCYVLWRLAQESEAEVAKLLATVAELTKQVKDFTQEKRELNNQIQVRSGTGVTAYHNTAAL